MKNTPFISEINKTTEGLSLPKCAYSPPDYTDEEAVNYIRYLPEEVMQFEHGIYLEPSDNNEKRMIEAIKEQYHNIAEWLEYYVLKDTQKLPELNHSESKNYKPLAEMSLATLRLIQEICAFAPWLNCKKISINRWWLAVEWELCDQLFRDSGYTGIPTLIGGSKAYKLAIYMDSLIEENQLQTLEIDIFNAPPVQALEGLAYAISTAKNNCAFRNHYQNYRKTQRAALRTLRDSRLNPMYLYNNQVITMKRGNRRLNKTL